MKNRILNPIIIALTLVVWMGVSFAATITVNTADNTDFSGGKTNLVSAINLLADGDTIQFNIPGAGPHYLVSPVGGYTAITNKHNVTIDGYSQPGSSPNTNPILSSNNANIKIVLTATNGELTVLDIPGYGLGESAVLFVYGSTNFTVKGICFLGPGGPEITPSPYAVSFAYNGATDAAHGGHVAGCRIGLDLDGTTIARFKDAVTAFGPGPINGTVVGVKAGPADSAAARAQFNIIMAMHIPVILEGNNYRISGNFFNVYPDGLRDFIADGGLSGPEHTLEAFMEFGGNQHHSLLIGTDGDGLNDAEERNVFGGVTSANDNRLLEWYSGGAPRTNIVIAGNYFGVGVDGLTRFTNSMKVFNGFNATATVQFGSDFNGVSDALEGNVISMNHPFDVVFSDPGSGTAVMPIFGDLSTGTRLSLRGNVLMGNNNPPYSWADGAGGRLAGFTNYYTPYMDINSSVIPTLDAASTFPRLKGTFGVGIDSYTNIIIDVYQLDQEGWVNGKTIAGTRSWIELTDSATFTNGFAQGSKYLGSRVVANTGSFDIDLSGMDLGPGQVIVTVNYSADPPGTSRGRVHTSNFSMPVSPLPADVASVGLTHIVPDTIFWYSISENRPKIGGAYNAADAAIIGGSVEAYAGVLGDSTFLLSAITKADDQTSMRHTAVYQPAGGGTPKVGDLFYADNGTPYTNQINLSRQDGNPNRVAGDPRYGAVNFMGGGEASLYAYPTFFNSDGRFDATLPFYAAMAVGNARDGCVQTFALNPLTLGQTMLSKAQDSAYGRIATNPPGLGASGDQLSRFGGHIAGLDNGNFVSVVEDRSRLFNPNGNASVATIFRPDGSIVKETFLVANGDQWANVAAFRGGFCVRPSGGFLYFYDNAGNLQGSVNHNESSGLSFDNGRGDGTRTASDIRSYYVFLAGRSPDAAKGEVKVAVWDARTRAFVAQATVTTTDPATHVVDRVNLAVDAYDRVCVAYRLSANDASFLLQQVAARVLAFDGSKFTYLTHTFYPFVGHDQDPANLLGYTTREMSVAMTPRQIFISAEGLVNSTNNPAAGPDVSDINSHVYTVISHPAPVAPLQPEMTVTRSGNNATISWLADAGLFTLQSAPAVSATSTSWSDVNPQPAMVRTGSGDPNDRYQMSVPVGPGNLYWRLLRRW